MRVIDPIKVTDTGAFSRSSVASFYTVDGRLGSAPANTPRLNYPPEMRIYAPAGWMAGPSLLIPSLPLPGLQTVQPAAAQFLAEVPASNVMLQSQDLTTWTASDVTVAANASVAPDGSSTADRIIPTATDTPDHALSKMGSGAVVAAGAQVAASIFLRAGGYGTARLVCAPAAQDAGFEMLVNLAEGDIPTAGSFGAGADLTAARLIVLAGGWYRLELEGRVAGETTFGLFLTVGDGLESYVGDTLAGIEAWGAQLEPGGATTYVPTGASIATRAADVGTPMLVSSVPEVEPVYSAAATYAKDAAVRGNTPETEHELFVSIQAGNTGKALTDAAWWLPAGATNRWAALDEVLGTRTVAPDAVTMVITSPERITALGAMNVDAAAMRVTMTDADDGVVYDQTVSLVSDDGINTWWAWFFEPITRSTYKTLFDLPPYAGAQLTVTFLNPGYTVSVGALVVGRGIRIGNTQWAPSIGIQDYTLKTRDPFGRLKLVERAFTPTAKFGLTVQPNYVDRLRDLLASFRARLIVYVGDETYGSTVVYGVFLRFEIIISQPTISHCTLELESVN